jgi:hypothetical protein
MVTKKRFIQSRTAQKVGWGSDRYRRVRGLSQRERQAVKEGHIVWFAYDSWHYTQSGYKVVKYWGSDFDSREPTAEELALIQEME